MDAICASLRTDCLITKTNPWHRPWFCTHLLRRRLGSPPRPHLPPHSAQAPIPWPNSPPPPPPPVTTMSSADTAPAPPADPQSASPRKTPSNRRPTNSSAVWRSEKSHPQSPTNSPRRARRNRGVRAGTRWGCSPAVGGRGRWWSVAPRPCSGDACWVYGVSLFWGGGERGGAGWEGVGRERGSRRGGPTQWRIAWFGGLRLPCARGRSRGGPGGRGGRGGEPNLQNSHTIH